MSGSGGSGGGKAWRPCCGSCRMTGLVRNETGWGCVSCQEPWDGSEVSADKLPEELEREIAAGRCTREQAYTAFLRMDDLAEAAAKGEITEAQGYELVVQDGLRVIGKARTQ